MVRLPGGGGARAVGHAVSIGDGGDRTEPTTGNIYGMKATDAVARFLNISESGAWSATVMDADDQLEPAACWRMLRRANRAGTAKWPTDGSEALRLRLSANRDGWRGGIIVAVPFG